MQNPIAQNVQRILAATVGDFVARAMLKKSCSLMGIAPEQLEPDHLTPLADSLGKSVSFFTGNEIGAEVAEQVRALEET